MKYLIEIAYLGTRFAGFQVQPDKITVQSTLQDAIEAVFGSRLPLKGCSRTDSGVHARQYFATFDSDKTIPTDRLPLALNANLPPDISVKSARIVPDEFHVRHDVEWKEYEYLLLNSRIKDPFLYKRAYQCRFMTVEQVGIMRIIVGTLIDCANGRIELSEMPKIIDLRDRSKAGATAPPDGLYLNRVKFRTIS